ncbi:MAG: hypothetical protein WD823_00145 [Sulfuricaulis sp.]|uniref:hypothetical protein n=1 Tax=Sulfuricaulis sp. TaxID=2003553 RepID=UPI0034A3DC99
MTNFLINQEWKKNPSLASGDLAILKFQDGFTYSIKCIVKSVASNNINGHIEAVFDAQSGGELVQHAMKNKKISFTTQHVFKVIKRNAP